MAPAMEAAPFEARFQLCHKLQVVDGQIKPQNDAKSEPCTCSNGKAEPQIDHELQHGDGTGGMVPRAFLSGEPRIELTDKHIGEYLRAEFVTEDLDRLAPFLWLTTTPRSDNVSCLTEQVLRGRKIIVMEKPGLHLVWIKNRVFLKPLPLYLLSHAFWQYYLVSAHSPIEEDLRKKILRAARGFLRTYKYLVQHESDFMLAVQEKTRLIPKGIEYAEFITMTNRYSIDDETVSPRYSKFGELRLSRLNLLSTVIVFRGYQKVEWQYGAYFAQYYAPLLFVFAVLSLLMSAMQLTLAVRAHLEPSDAWLVFARAARGFALFTIFTVVCIIALLLARLAVFVLKEVVFALRAQLKKSPAGDGENQRGAS